MVEFGTGYNHGMDREYGHHNHSHGQNSTGPSSNSTNDVGIGIKDIGMSLALGPVPNVTAVGAKLRAGMKSLELGFMGAGKGNAQSQTPEYYGKAQRKALEEIGKANEVNFTTHASLQIQGLAGRDQQGNFSRASKNFAVQEIKRAIEFAADVAKGGPVVVHTGEFERPISGAEWNNKGEYANKFEMYEHEKERESYRIVDSRSGKLITEANRNRKVSRPVWLRAEKDNPDNDVKKGDYIDYWGKKLTRAQRVPFYKDGEFQTRQYGWDDLEVEAKEMTREAKEDFRKWKRADKSERRKIEKDSLWRRFLKPEVSETDIRVRPEESFIIATFETNAGNARGWAHYYGADFDETVKNISRLKKARKFYQEIEDSTDEEEKWRLRKQAEALAGGLIPLEAKLPTEIIDRNLVAMENRIKQSREGSASQMAQAAEAMETIRHVQSAETYALQESYDAYAEAGMYAMEQTKKMRRKGDFKKPITVAMENLFPESFGAHPDEMTDLVQSSRKRMAEMLVRRGESKAKANKIAKDHITSTLDTGHINNWRKYWKGDHNKTVEQNDKEFDKWVVKKVAEMAKAEVIGHIHLDDNYGYHDDHLAPGEGNTPIKGIMKALKDNGYKGDLIVEPGADWTTDVGGFSSVMKTWRLFGSPVYGAGSGTGVRGRGWGKVGYGWFGENQPPYFVFGGYSPSEDWTLWSGVPLE
jgi:hypothetical protein